MSLSVPVQGLSEAQIQRAILDLLTAEGVFAMRLNTSMQVLRDASGKGRVVRSHSGGKGVADILAFPSIQVCTVCMTNKCKQPAAGATATVGAVLWIEVKRPGGKQSADQVSFAQRVRDEKFHFYLLATSTDDVLGWMRQHRRVRS
jgi:hypothetical protein